MSVCRNWAVNCSKRFRALLAALLPGATWVAIVAPAAAQTIPTIDTEDAILGSDKVASKGWLHPSFGIDLRNGDFARGNYDDDAADLDRLPAHLQIGIAADLHHGIDGKADTWLVARSSNGFHSPSRDEPTQPRSWYESNNLVALVGTPAEGVRAAVIYTIKTSPNGISDTTHEASVSFAYETRSGPGLLKPTFAATIRPKGDHGFYTQLGIEPELALGSADGSATLSFPATFGIGWKGFYQAGSENRLFGNAGLALSQPFSAGGMRWNARAEVLALIRDDRLGRLSGPNGETSTVVPLATLSINLAY